MTVWLRRVNLYHAIQKVSTSKVAEIWFTYNLDEFCENASEWSYAEVLYIWKNLSEA